MNESNARAELRQLGIAPILELIRNWMRAAEAEHRFGPEESTFERRLSCDEPCLGEKLGPLLFRFGYFNKKALLGVNDFLARLVPFLKKLPKGYRFAVEIRNKTWLVPQFVEALRERQIALALVDHVWLPRPKQLFERFDPITTDFTYVRWIGDRKGIEQETKTRDRVIVDRSGDLAEWVEVLKTVHKRKIQILAFANNHYAGYGPGTVELFQDQWRRAVKHNGKSKRAAPQGQLFK